jgi:hypothetical protein
VKFKKDVLSVGATVKNVRGEEVLITEEYLQKLVENTEASGHDPFIPFRHSFDPRDNTGFVFGWVIDDDKLWMKGDVDDETGEKLNKTIKGVTIGTMGKPEDGGYIHHVGLTVKP